MKKDAKIVLSGENGEELFHGKITSIPLSEDLVIRKSIEFFNDDSPCFIHRSAVMKRLFLELEDYLEKKALSGCCELYWEDIPDKLKEILAHEDKIVKVLYIR